MGLGVWVELLLHKVVIMVGSTLLTSKSEDSRPKDGESSWPYEAAEGDQW